MLTVHHLNNSRSQRVLWLLEELGLEYEIKRYQRDAVTMLAPPSLKAVHPLGKSPVLTDDDIVVAESGAIVEYLMQNYGKQSGLCPVAGSSEARRYTYWLHYAEGSAMPPLLMGLVFARLPKSPMPFFIRPVVSALAAKVRKSYIEPQLTLHARHMDSELETSGWFAGEFSAADIQMSFPVQALVARAGGAMAGCQRLTDFVRRIEERPAYQRALGKGGPFELMS